MSTAVSVTDTMYGLEIEVLIDGSVGLEADAGSGEVERIMLHPAQLRWIAESAGLLRAPATPDLQAPSIPELERTITRLQRALLMARLQAEELRSDLQLVAGQGHEMLDIEIAHAQSMEDFLCFVCGEFEDEFTNPSPRTTNQSPTATSSPSGLVAQGDHSAALPRAGSRTGAAPKGTPKVAPKVAPKPPLGEGPGPLFAEDGEPQP